MSRQRIEFLFLNVGHFLDHLFLLIFATVAALSLGGAWAMSYAELIPYATPGFVAFGVCALPAGWLADKWSREGMMAIFFAGIGAASIATGFARTPLEIGAGLLAIGVFGSIYHPVGLAMVVEGRARTGIPIAVNGVYGNLGVAGAALITGFLIDQWSWRLAFILPGVLSIAVAFAYTAFIAAGRTADNAPADGPAAGSAAAPLSLERRLLARVFVIIFVSTAIGGLIFQSTTFALPKVFDERLGALAGSATLVGWYAFVVFAIASFAQLVIGYSIDRYSLRTIFAIVAGGQVVFLAAMQQLTGVAALIVAMAFMLVVFGQIPINDVLIGRITRSAWRARVFALRYIVTFSVMATALPMIAGLHAGWGFSALFLVLAGAAAVIFAAVVLLPRAAGAVAAMAPAE